MNALTRSNRGGMTLVEMLVATTCTLILMGAIAQVFGAFGNAVSESRAMIELDNQLRTVSWRLRNDLSGATARTLPPLEVEAGEGYFEIIEGPLADSAAIAPRAAVAASDIDDVLLFTTRNTETPYLGRYDVDPSSSSAAITKTMESQLAEVAWFLRPTTGVSGIRTYTLFRRQLLVAGYVGAAPFYGDRYPNAVVYDPVNGYPNNPNGHLPANPYSAFSSWGGFFDCFDLSVKIGDVGLPPVLLQPNTLADLTRRENRFLHNPLGTVNATVEAFPPPTTPTPRPPTFVFPSAAIYQADSPPDGLIFTGAGRHPRIGEDVILSNVISFDVRVFDPAAPLQVRDDVALVPGDPGFDDGAAAMATGGYVDLGWAKGPVGSTLVDFPHAPRFGDLGSVRSGLRPPNRAAGACTYDTWSTHYESNGINDDYLLDDQRKTSDPLLTDQGANGLDDITYDDLGAAVPANGLVDDRAELETLPPYPAALRGIEVRIRCYEPSSRQVRQVTVRHSFVPR